MRSNVKFAQSIAMLSVFEDTDAVIKKITKGRSPTMRHVSRTHRVSFGCLTGLIWISRFKSGTWSPNTRSQTYWLTDTSHVTNGIIFFVCLNISHFGSLCCAKMLSFNRCTEKWQKRMQEQSEENRIVAKSGPKARNLTSSVATSSFSVNSPTASRSTGVLKASSRQVGLSGRLDVSTYQNSNPDAASSPQEWQRDANWPPAQGNFWATGKDQKSLNRQDESVISTDEFVAIEYQGCSGVLQNAKDSEPWSRIWPHHFSISPDCTTHGESLLDREKDFWSETDG